MAATPTVGESNIKIIVTAIAVALAVFLFTKLGGLTSRSNEDTIFMRMVFAAASVLIMLDVVEGA